MKRLTAQPSFEVDKNTGKKMLIGHIPGNCMPGPAGRSRPRAAEQRRVNQTSPSNRCRSAMLRPMRSSGSLPERLDGPEVGESRLGTFGELGDPRFLLSGYQTRHESAIPRIRPAVPLPEMPRRARAGESLQQHEPEHIGLGRKHEDVGSGIDGRQRFPVPRKTASGNRRTRCARAGPSPPQPWIPVGRATENPRGSFRPRLFPHSRTPGAASRGPHQRAVETARHRRPVATVRCYGILAG